MPSPDHQSEPAGLRGLFARVFRLLRSWWQADRVRISPSEGRLLSLPVPCILRIGGRYVQVRRRCTGMNADGPYVLYECIADTQPAQLIVSPCPAPRLQVVQWRCEGVGQALDPDDIEVFACAKPAPR